MISTISFSVASAGNYSIYYSVSNYRMLDAGTISIDNNIVYTISSGSHKKTIDLGYLDSSNVVEIKLTQTGIEAPCMEEVDRCYDLYASISFGLTVSNYYCDNSLAQIDAVAFNNTSSEIDDIRYIFRWY